jgi:hypothetical protein
MNRQHPTSIRGGTPGPILARGAFCLWILLLWLPLRGWANLPKPANDEIPPLKPPLGEIPPGVWEEHGPAIVIGGTLALAALAAVAWLALRQRPENLPSPERQARSQLAELRGKAQTGQLISTVSRVTRGYFRDAFGLTANELTTREFCDQMETRQEVGSELGGQTRAFLMRCDELKFSPNPVPGAFDATAESLKLVELGENRLQEVRRQKPESPETPGGGTRPTEPPGEKISPTEKVEGIRRQEVESDGQSGRAARP